MDITKIFPKLEALFFYRILNFFPEVFPSDFLRKNTMLLAEKIGVMNDTSFVFDGTSWYHAASKIKGTLTDETRPSDTHTKTYRHAQLATHKQMEELPVYEKN